MRLKIFTFFIVIYSPNVFACSMDTGLEEAMAFLAYMVSVLLAIYAIFSRLSYRPKYFYVPLIISLIFGYLGLSEIGCVDSSPVLNSLITLFGITALAIYETYARKKYRKNRSGNSY